jgi:hypothetical protein
MGLINYCSEDLDYDDGLCCTPHGWCEFFHYVFYQVLCGVIFWWCLFTLVGDRIKLNLLKLVRYEGVAFPVTVIDKHATRRCYGCCNNYTQQQSVRVEFFNLLWPGKITKDIKVSQDLYQKINVPCDYVIFHLTEYPRSAVMDDPVMKEKYSSNLKLVLMGTVCVVNLIAMIISFVWYTRTYDSAKEGFLKILHMHLIQLVIAGLCWAYASRQAERHEDSVLREECSEEGLPNRAINDYSYKQGLLERP